MTNILFYSLASLSLILLFIAGRVAEKMILNVSSSAGDLKSTTDEISETLLVESSNYLKFLAARTSMRVYEIEKIAEFMDRLGARSYVYADRQLLKTLHDQPDNMRGIEIFYAKEPWVLKTRLNTLAGEKVLI